MNKVVAGGGYLRGGGGANIEWRFLELGDAISRLLIRIFQN